MRRRKSPLPTVVAGRQTGFPAEELGEMAGVGVAHVERDFRHAPLRIAQPPARLIHPQRKPAAVTPNATAFRAESVKRR